MTSLIILTILLLFIGYMWYSIAQSKKNEEQDFSLFTPSGGESKQTVSTKSGIKESCPLAIALRIAGGLWIFSAIIIGPTLNEYFGLIISIAIFLSCCTNCLIFFALAKFVDAADKYLNNH